MNEHHIRENLLQLIGEIDDYELFLLDPQGLIASWNPGIRKIKGYDPHEVIGRHFRLFYLPEDARQRRPEKLLAEAKAKGRIYEEGWRLRKDGSRFWAAVNLRALYDKEGELAGFGKITRDLTERRMAERARLLDIRNADLERFAYIASHDLQEPLRTVSNYIQLLGEDFGERLGAEGEKLLSTVSKAAARMRKLVAYLLDYSQIGETGNATVVPVRRVVDDVLAELAPQVAESRAVVTVEPLPETAVYEPEFRELWKHLIGNALKFRSPDIPPEIRIGVVTGDESHEFFVADNGIGIGEHHFDRIFQIFQRLHPAKLYPGYGFGLAYSKKVAELHGGGIRVVSGPDLGSTFYFTIPTQLL